MKAGKGRTGEQVSLAQALAKAIDRGPLKHRIQGAQVLVAAEDILGPTVTASITKMYLKDECLWIHTPSAPLRNELFLTRDSLKVRINDVLGREVIKEVALAG